ncbi:hypothetical protein BC835DRAFT_1098427 [Cytidiella melzeri]|nr:hypothetical protein BC835DRAFT_1098427 [Cytidiella melzeri]
MVAVVNASLFLLSSVSPIFPSFPILCALHKHISLYSIQPNTLNSLSLVVAGLQARGYSVDIHRRDFPRKPSSPRSICFKQIRTLFQTAVLHT